MRVFFFIIGQCWLHLTVVFEILRQWSIIQAPRLTATNVASYGPLKRTDYTGKQLFFSPLWKVMQIHRTDSEMWTWLCHLHAPNSTWQQTKERKETGEEKQKRTERRYSSDDSLVSPAAAAVAPDLKGFLWLAKTNRAVWEHPSAAE